MAERRYSDREFWELSEPLIERALGEINDVAKPSDVTTVLRLFLHRVTTTVHAMLAVEAALHDNAAHDLCTLLRSAYDVYIQATHVTSDSPSAAQRARDFLDFVTVERFFMLERVQKGPSAVRDHIMNSPLRQEGEPQLKLELERIRHRFEDKGKLRRNWYRGDLRQLAEKAGLLHEYDLVIARLHPSVHSSPFALLSGSGVLPEHATFFAIRLVFRLVGLIALHHGVRFKDEQVKEAVDAFAPGLFAPP